MPQQFYLASEIKGLTPAVDGRVSKSLFVLSGRNYRFDSRGPRSAFGSKLTSPTPVAQPLGAQTFDVRAGTQVITFLITADAISYYQSDMQDWVILLAIPNTGLNVWRWSRGYLNQTIFLCHPSVGIVYWKLATNEVGFYRVAGAPSQPIGVIVNNGRLVIMDSYAMSWSAPFDGFNFTPSLGGAGAQQISQHVSGAPIAMTAHSKGILTWTNDGVMRSEYTGDEAVYRHRAMNTKYRPINSFCVAQMDDETTVLLDPRGLYATTGGTLDYSGGYKSGGETPSGFAPLFSEFLIEYLRINGLRVGNNTRLEWDATHQQLFVSISHDYEGPFFSYAFACQVNIDKWGSFNRRHFGMGSMGDLEFGYIGENGFVRRFGDDARLDSHAGVANADLIRADGVDIAQRTTANASWIMGTSCRAYTRSVTIGAPSGWYAPASLNPSPYPQAALDSQVLLGYMRGADMTSNDRLTEVTQLMIGSVESVADNSGMIDSNALSGVADGNLLRAGVDLGFHPIGLSNYSVTVTSTLDGTTTFDTENPPISAFTPASRYYSLTVSGLWHTLAVSAVNVGDRYHIRSLEMTYVDGGRFL